MGVGSGDHKSVDQIQLEIKDARQKIQVGGTYQHYKGKDKLYEVLDFATLEATDELCVIYKPLYVTADLKFVRPVSVWLETVEWEGKTVPRFTKV